MPDSERRARLVIVEDNPGDVELLRWALENAGVNFDLTVLPDGGAALDFIRHQSHANEDPSPDLMILDLNLPKASGSEILTAMRSDAKFAKTPVAVLTSSNTTADRSLLEQLDVCRYFVRPPDLREVLNLGKSIRDVLTELSGNGTLREEDVT